MNILEKWIKEILREEADENDTCFNLNTTKGRHRYVNYCKEHNKDDWMEEVINTFSLNRICHGEKPACGYCIDPNCKSCWERWLVENER